ncbi:AraC family transcriptional regulator [Cohnella zeiphila]|uniref:Helix-turn-helix transcriptional regulator n=1 Tax=Cohnella zeiphila TaxID=2761120 RepID=A0A7X0SJD6_9BACL|nr:AraC family transcriptional regulator [Cohnella zeiphila]MBB6731068.1 helix-turn-helix transcriptional regulator [Cohnella zeiphila]
MSFQQLADLIPELIGIETGHRSRTIDEPAGTYVLLSVRRGHVRIRPAGAEPLVCAQGYACHPGRGPYRIEAPKTKEADYVLLYYRMLPADGSWSLEGPLQTVSETKIRYMLDELLSMKAPVGAAVEREAAFRYKQRMMLERVLYIYLYETGLKPADGPSADALAETLSYLNEHYMLKLTLPMLAKRAGMSEGHFTVLFKRLTGTTMTGYLRALRIEKAKRMFEETRLSAKEIAQRVGFADYFHFSRVFKQEAGLSPLGYKQERERNLKI